MRFLQLLGITSLVLCIANAYAQDAPLEPQVEQAAEICAVLFEDPSGTIEHVMLSSLHISGLTDDEPFVLPADAPANVKVVQCGRSSLPPQRNDYKVLAAGFPFAIVADERVGILEIVFGQLHFRMLEGEMTDNETKLVQTFLNESQESFNKPAGVAP